MQTYGLDSIHNVILLSHGGAGKTSLSEAMLFTTGATSRLGKVDEGNTTSDYDPDEVKRKISINLSIIPLEWQKKKINILDAPGYTDFVGEVISALRVVEGALVLVDSVAGLEVGTEIAWDTCDTFKLPRFLVVNKMERDNANFQKTIASVQEHSGIRLIPVQIPWGEKAEFQGVIDVLRMKAFKGNSNTPVEIPAELKGAADDAHAKLVEAAAEGDDSLMEKYFATMSLTDDELIQGLRKIVRAGSYAPVFVSSGQQEIGAHQLLDAILELIPSPVEAPAAIAKGKEGDEELKASDSGPLAAYVWKTTADPFVGKQTFFRIYSGTLNSDSRVWNQTKGIEERLGQISIPRGKETMPVKIVHSGDIGVVPKLMETSTGNTLCDKTHPLSLPMPAYPHSLFQVAIFPKTQADATKISPTLTRLCEEDPTISWRQEMSTNQTILQGMGDQHIDVIIRRAETKFQVNLTTSIPKVPYQETITKKGEGMHRHKKQTGGAGQFGEVWLRIEPSPDKDFDFSWDVFGGAVSQSYSSSIQKGILATMKEGILAGYPVSKVHVSIYDGKEHPVDSKPIAFEVAGREAFKVAFHDAGPVLLEPIMSVKIVVPESNMGDVLGDMNTRRARVQGMESEKGHSTITAHVPLAEMMRYTTQLRSFTGGRGHFTMEHDHYEVVPANLTQEIVAQRQKDLQQKKEE